MPLKRVFVSISDQRSARHKRHDLAARVRQLRSQVLVFARAHFQKCHYNSANCSGAAGFSIPKA